MTEQMTIFSITGNLNTRQYKLLDFLKNNAVGKKNAFSGNELIKQLREMYPDEFDKRYNKVVLQADIRAIRMNKLITRKIGSSSNGYWLMTEEEKQDGLKFLKNLAATHIKTAINQGVPLNFFYSVLNDLENVDLLDHQQKIQFSSKQKPEVSVYSDDLKNENV